MCNLPPALWAEWLGSFTCHCGNTGVEQTPNKSQHTKLTLEKKIFPLLLPGFKLKLFDHKSGTLTSKLSQLPTVLSYTEMKGWSRKTVFEKRFPMLPKQLAALHPARPSPCQTQPEPMKNWQAFYTGLRFTEESPVSWLFLQPRKSKCHPLPWIMESCYIPF